jgi:hypothetical protein
MPKQVYMQADDGKLSRGHVYTVSKQVAKRLLRTTATIEIRRPGRGSRTERGRLAVIATAEHLKPEAERAVADPVVLVRMARDVGRFSAGRTYGFSPEKAKQYCEGYKSGGRTFPPVGVLVNPPPEPVKAFNPEAVQGLSRRMLKDLADLGYKTPEEINTARITELTVVRGLGPKIAERLKALASEHAE